MPSPNPKIWNSPPPHLSIKSPYLIIPPFMRPEGGGGGLNRAFSVTTALATSGACILNLSNKPHIFYGLLAQ